MNSTAIADAAGSLGDVLGHFGCTSSTISDCLPSGSALMVAGGALALGYTVWEQAKFRWYRMANKGGETIPGKLDDHGHSTRTSRP